MCVCVCSCVSSASGCYLMSSGLHWFGILNVSCLDSFCKYQHIDLRDVCSFFIPTAWWSSLSTTHSVNWEPVGWYPWSHSCATYTCFEVKTQTDLFGSYVQVWSHWATLRMDKPICARPISSFSMLSQMLMSEMKPLMCNVSPFKE